MVTPDSVTSHVACQLSVSATSGAPGWMCHIATGTRASRAVGLTWGEEQDGLGLGTALGDQHVTAIVRL